MSNAPKSNSRSRGRSENPDGVRANRRDEKTPSPWPTKQHGQNPAPTNDPSHAKDNVPARPAFGAGTEGLCQTMPEIGMMPYKRHGARPRVVRLVSATPETKLSIELQPGVNRIGRQRANNHIVLVSPQVSRFHAEIDISISEIVLRDLDSANGSFVNGQRVTAHVLQAGDLIAFSDQFALRLLIDVAVQEADSVNLGQVAQLGAIDQGTRGQRHPPADAVPASLEARIQSSPGIDIASFAPPSSPAPPRRVTAEPVEIAAPDSAAAPASRLDDTKQPRRDPARRIPPPLGRPGDGVDAAQVAERAQHRRSERLAPVPALSTHNAAPENLENLDETHVSREIARPSSEIELAVVERERRQLAVLYQVSKRCMSAQSLAELDGLLISVLERVVSFDRCFVTYQLPSSDWKLVMSPRGDRWPRRLIRNLVQKSVNMDQAIVIADSAQDRRLGFAEDGSPDHRLLQPLRSRDTHVGAIFLLCTDQPFDAEDADFLSLFADIAALSLVNCARLEGG